MATARVLPSGKWRCLVFDRMENGKRKYKSFTADTKNDAELAAKLYLKDPSRKNAEKITVKNAIDRYIKSKDGVPSPSTIRGYKAMQSKKFESINGKDIYKLTTEDMQKFVSETSKENSAKYTGNVYGLLSSSVTMFRPDAIFRVTLPKKAVKRKSAPSDEDVKTLFNYADGDLKICIALAAFGSLRRGEICALKHGDIDGNNIYVHADIVMDSDNKTIYKDMPKTSDSVRVVTVPQQVIDLIGSGKKDAFITHFTPTGISNAFGKLRKTLGIEVRFHDLRHYFASIGAVLNVPDIYLADFGGWKRGSPVMKEVYQNVMNDRKKNYSDTMTAHFEKLIAYNATKNTTQK